MTGERKRSESGPLPGHYRAGGYMERIVMGGGW